MISNKSFAIKKISFEQVEVNHMMPFNKSEIFNFSFDESYGVVEFKSCAHVRLSLIFKTLAGLLAPIRGVVKINDQDFYGLDFYESLHLRLKIGYSFDLGGLINNRTIIENLMLPLDYHNWGNSDERRDYLFELLNDFQIFSFKDFLPAFVPGRVRKMTIVLRSILFNPDLVLLDDPWMGISEQQRLFFVNFIENKIKEGIIRFVFINDSLNIHPFKNFSIHHLEPCGREK